ncbi:hydrolase (plasmid) [Rhizobium leguminosarum bv. trifolii CB782]|uniref:amidohydrolase family protein n=1 Tax=Rhizobium hidalgonense TaxID=1538159 RepID=UPI00027D2D8E|nr:amidohydrolase family protein [Rhizobium hidalgonense]AHG48412.1 hydrolase [Rhizobium leguminosarum bv. trifolii CB782]EJC72097.1 putative TIM-barrel fold metal-dependent hydrolase [Rhizobium leguminosarum bv. trifolii WSM2012]QKK26103.1 amidohydrolase family protein [Rhizobium hidalgonense]RWX18549.1 hydrolase [Rhizobium hidalgonense]
MTQRYDGPVIDPHHHLWDLGLQRHPWLQKARASGEEMVFGSLAPILRDYGIDDYRADAARQDVIATVHVEAGWSVAYPLEESRWLDGLDRSSGVARRYIARVPLDGPDAQRLLEAEAENSNVVGIRDILSWHPDAAKSFASRPDRMGDPAWRAGLAHATRLGLVFDLMLYPWQMAEALELVQAFPETLFVLNHGGSPADRTKDGMALWQGGLWALGGAPNVRVKISDLVAYDHAWTLESLRPVIEHCLDCFGPARAMFASDFPVAGLHASFDEVYQTFRTVAAELSLDEQRALFFATANDTYRLGLADPAEIGRGRHV